MEKICPICYDNLEDNEIKLVCGHSFHYKCIYHQYLNSSKRICPYCRCYGGYLQLQRGEFPKKNIHSEYNIIEKNIKENNIEKLEKITKKYIDTSKCHCIILKGKNKGTQCRKTKQKNGDYCFIHKKI